MANWKKRIRPRDPRGDYSGFNLSIGLSYNHGWNRAKFPQPEPEVVCPNCKIAGYVWRWKLSRDVQAFGNLVHQEKDVLECKNCMNEHDLGTVDTPITKEQVRKRGVNLRKLTKEQMARLMQVMALEEQKEKKEG